MNERTLGTRTTGRARSPLILSTHVFGSHQMTESELRQSQGITVHVFMNKTQNQPPTKVVTAGDRVETFSQTN